ncbi:hypothetical protein SAMN04487982_103650 [Streptomyces sp. ok210]|jgi:hypothetical protein|nr:hypothetical protein SAMN04487982_103650 [Streptomyces sp. ok210]
MRREWPVQWSGTLARVSVEVPGPLRRYGRPIRYGYTERDQPRSAYQTVFAVDSTCTCRSSIRNMTLRIAEATYGEVVTRLM